MDYVSAKRIYKECQLHYLILCVNENEDVYEYQQLIYDILLNDHLSSFDGRHLTNSAIATLFAIHFFYTQKIDSQERVPFRINVNNLFLAKMLSLTRISSPLAIETQLILKSLFQKDAFNFCYRCGNDNIFLNKYGLAAKRSSNNEEHNQFKSIEQNDLQQKLLENVIKA